MEPEAQPAHLFGIICIATTVGLWLLVRLLDKAKIGARPRRMLLGLGFVLAPSAMLLVAGQTSPPRQAELLREMEVCAKGVAGAAATAMDLAKASLPSEVRAEFPWHDFRYRFGGLCRVRVDAYFQLAGSDEEVAYWAKLEKHGDRWQVLTLVIPDYQVYLSRSVAASSQ